MKKQSVLLWIIFGIGLAMRLWLIVSTNTHYDEMFTVTILDKCGLNWFCMMEVDPGLPPLQYLWFGLFRFVFNNIVFLRLFSALIFWVGVYWIGGLVVLPFGKVAQIIFAFLSAFSSFQIQFSWVGYVYGMMAFWTVVVLYLTQKLKTGKLNQFLLLCCLVLGFLTHYSFVWLSAAFILWSFVTRKYRIVAVIYSASILAYVWKFKEMFVLGYSHFYVDPESLKVQYLWKTWGAFFGGDTGMAVKHGYWMMIVFILLVFWVGKLISKDNLKKSYLMLVMVLTVTFAVSVSALVLPISSPPNQIRTFVPASICYLMILSIFWAAVLKNNKIAFYIFVLVYLGLNLNSFKTMVNYLKGDVWFERSAKVISEVTECKGNINIKYYPFWIDLPFEYNLNLHSGKKCEVTNMRNYEIEAWEDWWILRGKNKYISNSDLFELEKECPRVISRWQWDTEELWKCSNE